MAVTEIELLRKMAAFGGLKPAVLELIHSQAQTVLTSAGECFFREGDPGESLFVLETGTVLVFRERDGQRYELGRLKGGDCFGEMALIDFRSRSASVIAETDCQAMQISRRFLADLYRQDVEQYAIVMMNLGREVSRRLRATDDCLFRLRHHHLMPST